jgi:small subunit ribosomal protein S3Ae
LQNVYIRKAKILKSPKLDLGKLLESHGEIETVRTGTRAIPILY